MYMDATFWMILQDLCDTILGEDKIPYGHNNVWKEYLF